VDVLKELAQLGPSLRLESHKVDVMTHTLGVDITWRLSLEAREDTRDNDT
jgi:hypothetical protein